MPGNDKDFLIRVRADIKDALNQFGILRKENEKLGKSLSGKNTDSAFGNIGIRNFRTIRREIKLVEASYKRLAQSGKLSQKDLSIAARKSKQRIKELRRELNGAKDSAFSFGRAISAAVAIESTRRVLLQADAYNVLQVRIRTATKETGDYAQISRQLSDITKETGGELSSTVSLFQNLARSGKDLQATNQEMITLTRIVQQLGVISGTTQAQQRAGLLQFSQGLAEGIFRAQEYNSLIENLPEVATRIEKGLGKSRAEVRKLLLDGELLSTLVFRSLVDQSEDIADEFREIPLSLERSVSTLGTSFDQFLSKLDRATGATGLLARGFDNAGQMLDGFNTVDPKAFTKDELQKRIKSVTEEITQLTEETSKLQLLNPIFAVFGDVGRIASLKAQLNQLLEAQKKLNSFGTINRGGASAPTPTGPTAAQKKASEEAEKLSASLKKQLALLDANVEATVRYEIETGKLVDLLPAEREELLKTARALDERRLAIEKEKTIKADLASDRSFIKSLRDEFSLVGLSERAQQQLTSVRNLSANATTAQRNEVRQLAGALYDETRALEANKQLQEVRIRLLEAQGRTVEASRLRLQNEFGGLLETLKQQGDTAGIEIVNKLINTEQARVQLSELERQYSLTLNNLATQEQRIQTDIEVGLISESKGRSDIIALHQQTQKELEKLIPKMRELAATIGPEAVASVNNYAEEIRKLGLVVDELAARVDKAIDSGLTDFFDEWASSSKSAGDAFKDFADVVIGEIRRIFAEQASKEIQGLFKSATGGSSFGDLFSSITSLLFHDGGVVGSGGSRRQVSPLVFAGAPRYHSGGTVPGLKADERPAILQTGERVLSRYEVANGVGSGSKVDLGGIHIVAADAKSFLDQLDNVKDEASLMLSGVAAELNLGGAG